MYREKIEQFSGKQNYVSVSKMAKSGVWGADIEIMAVGRILDTNVYTSESMDAASVGSSCQSRT